MKISKIDAGVTILITPDMQVVELPASLFQKDVEAGSFVSLHIEKHRAAEQERMIAFDIIQKAILQDYGQLPEPPSIYQLEDCNGIGWHPFTLHQHTVHRMAWHVNKYLLDKSQLELDMASRTLLSLKPNPGWLDTTIATFDLQLCLMTSSGLIWSNVLTLSTAFLNKDPDR